MPPTTRVLVCLQEGGRGVCAPPGGAAPGLRVLVFPGCVRPHPLDACGVHVSSRSLNPTPAPKALDARGACACLVQACAAGCQATGRLPPVDHAGSHIHELCCPLPCVFAEFDRRFYTYEVPLSVAEEERQRFLASRPKDKPVVRVRLQLGQLGQLAGVSHAAVHPALRSNCSFTPA